MKDRPLNVAAGIGGREVRTVRASHRRAMTVLVVLLLACAGAAAALAFSAAPAHAFGTWEHDGASQCSACHTAAVVTDQQCTTCHAGFVSVPGDTCWSCHAPGADTSTLSSPSAACSQDCHLYDTSLKLYATAFTHGLEPHLGASGFGKTCLDCHSTSAGIADPDGSPHHSGKTVAPPPTCRDCHDGVIAVAQVSHDGVDCIRCHTGMNIPAVPAACYTCHVEKTFGAADCRACHANEIHNAAPSAGTCTTCHSGYRKHAGSVACTKCHTNAAAFHHGTAAMKSKRCGSCHTKKHAGRVVSLGKCATCHKGNAPTARPRVQHSSQITKKRVCSACHSKALHAKARGAKLTCRTCHTAKFHARQPRPSNSVCLRCHSRASSHAVGFACVICHRRTVHDATPDVRPVRAGV